MARPPGLNDFPESLKILRRWVAWRYEIRNGKASKRPLQSIKNPRAWLSFAEACSCVTHGGADGVGFVLGEGLVGIDLDACIDADGTLHEIARDAVGLGTYAERSPSGRGLHLFIRATIPQSRKVSARRGVPGREIYDGREGSARYLTVTGDFVGDAPRVREGPKGQATLDAFYAKWFTEESEGRAPAGDAAIDCPEPLEDSDVLRIMFKAMDGAKWRRLFEGDHSDYRSQSEADFALCRKLRFYTHADRSQMDRLFRRSGLMRAKWDQKHGPQTYGEGTIAKAIGNGGPLYIRRDRDIGVKTRDTWERKAWAKVPAWTLVRLGGAGELACRVYGIIACYANNKGEAWPSVETIAAHLHVSERRVKAAIATLKAANLITSTQRPGTSNLYNLALRVPEAITPYATRRAALGVTESGHLGCRSHGTVTNQEPTIYRHRGERVTRQQKKTGRPERDDPKRAAFQKEVPIPGPPRPSPKVQKHVPPDAVVESDETASVSEARALLWAYAEERLGLVGPIVCGSKIFRSAARPLSSRNLTRDGQRSPSI